MDWGVNVLACMARCCIPSSPRIDAQKARFSKCARGFPYSPALTAGRNMTYDAGNVRKRLSKTFQNVSKLCKTLQNPSETSQNVLKLSKTLQNFSAPGGNGDGPRQTAPVSDFGELSRAVPGVTNSSGAIGIIGLSSEITKAGVPR